MARPHILVVDDSPTIQAFIRAVLGEEYEYGFAENGVVGLEVLGQSRPDLVISDVLMPEMDGIELCRRARALPGHAKTPFILVTSDAGADGKATGLESGADDYLSKPIRPRELVARVKGLLTLHETQRHLLERTHELEEANQSLVQMQQQLVEAEKMAAMGTLVGGIAHEINNPLTYVNSGLNAARGYSIRLLEANLALLADLAPERRADVVQRFRLEPIAEDLPSVFREVAEGVSRIRDIVQKLAAGQSNAQGPQQLTDVRGELTEALRQAAPILPGVRIEVIGADELPPMEMVPGSLGQAFRNVAVNAMQAMRKVKEPTFKVRVGRQGSCVRIELEDNGHGIAPEHLSRVFDPFFTTRPPGEGTGLGLSVSNSLVKRLGGRITLTSAVGVGTTVVIELPLASPQGASGYNRLRTSGSGTPPGGMKALPPVV